MNTDKDFKDVLRQMLDDDRLHGIIQWAPMGRTILSSCDHKLVEADNQLSCYFQHNDYNLFLDDLKANGFQLISTISGYFEFGLKRFTRTHEDYIDSDEEKELEKQELIEYIWDLEDELVDCRERLAILSNQENCELRQIDELRENIIGVINELQRVKYQLIPSGSESDVVSDQLDCPDPDFYSLSRSGRPESP